MTMRAFWRVKDHLYGLHGPLLIALAAVLVYARTFFAGYIWDDDFYVWNNPTLKTLGGIFDIWFRPLSIPQYYPLVHTTYWLEYRLWGDHPAGYHVVNVLLHAGNAVLLWFVLRRLDVPAAWLGALLFAVHPVGVESVAWVTERKNTLSLCLALGSLLAWLRFQDDEPRGLHSYAISVALFAASLLAKTVTVSLVGVLLVLTWWKTGRITLRDLRLVAPYLAVGLPLALATVWLEKHHVGAGNVDWGLSPFDRIVLAGRAVCFYASKLVWPHPLAFFYDRWQIDARQAWQWVYPLACLAVAAAAWRLQTRIGRGPLAIWLLFVGCLFPALGFFDVYPFKFSFVADHFAYHAMPAILAGMAAMIFAVAGRAGVSLAIPAAGIISILVALSWIRTGAYRDQETLYLDTLAKTPSCGIAAGNLGAVYLEQGRLSEAIPALERGIALAQFPDDRARSLANLAEVFLRLDRPREAMQHAQASLAANGTYRGRWLLAQAAVRSRNRAVADRVIAGLLPEDLAKPEIQLALGERALQAGDKQEAVRYFDACLPPAKTPARNNALLEIGLAYLAAGDIAAASTTFVGIEASPPLAAKAQLNIGVAEAMRGNLAAARARFEQAVAIDPRSAEAHGNLGKALLAVGESARALEHLDMARRLAGPNFTFQAEYDAARRVTGVTQ
jgi:tetratricopeptide (TPR) repeat protein